MVTLISPGVKVIVDDNTDFPSTLVAVYSTVLDKIIIERITLAGGAEYLMTCSLYNEHAMVLLKDDEPDFTAVIWDSTTGTYEELHDFSADIIPASTVYSTMGVSYRGVGDVQF